MQQTLHLTESLILPDTLQSGDLEVGEVNNFGSVTSMLQV